MSQAKPKVRIPTNFDQLMAYADAIGTSIVSETSTFTVADNVDLTALTNLVTELGTERTAAMADHAAALNAAAEAKLKNSQRNTRVENIVRMVRDLRDLGFAEFPNDYTELVQWGFDVIESPSQPNPPPPAE